MRNIPDKLYYEVQSLEKERGRKGPSLSAHRNNRKENKEKKGEDKLGQGNKEARKGENVLPGEENYKNRQKPGGEDEEKGQRPGAWRSKEGEITGGNKEDKREKKR